MTHTPDSKEAKLLAMLREDIGDEADQFLPVVLELNQLPALSVSQAEIEQITSKLRGVAPAQPKTRWWDRWFPLLILRAELQLLRYELWLSSALVMIIGLLVTVATHNTTPETLPFIQIAPVMAVLGVAFIFNLNTEPPPEIVLACLISIRTILLARLTVIFSINLLLGVAGSLLLIFTDARLSLWPLVVAWLAPMLLLSALAFFLAITAKDPLFGSAVSLVVWIWQHIDLPYLKPPVMIAKVDDALLLIITALLCGAAFWLAGKDERWIGASK